MMDVHLFEEAVQWRRHLHAHPELSYEEEETSAFVCSILTELGIPYTRHIGGHGVVGHIRGGLSNGDLIALRADMDALPIQEENDVPYKSKNKGKMHACGHDVHTANLLAVAAALNKRKESLDRDIRLIFQPAEEKLPGGASYMIKDGVLENPVPRCIVGFHVFPQMEVGAVGMRPGPYMASADEIYITVRGKGGHAALPQTLVDPIYVSAQLITQLQSVVSRNADPTIPTVLSFGKINSKGGATNVIPDEVYIEGTFRTMDEVWRTHAHDRIRQICQSVGDAFAAEIEVRIDVGYPVLNNDVNLTGRAFEIAEELLGEDRVSELPIRMTAEDFAYYSHLIPACFIRIGTSNREKNIGAPLHTSKFDVDEDAFKTSVPLMVELAAKI